MESTSWWVKRTREGFLSLFTAGSNEEEVLDYGIIYKVAGTTKHGKCQVLTFQFGKGINSLFNIYLILIISINYYSLGKGQVILQLENIDQGACDTLFTNCYTTHSKFTCMYFKLT